MIGHFQFIVVYWIDTIIGVDMLIESEVWSAFSVSDDGWVIYFVVGFVILQHGLIIGTWVYLWVDDMV